MSVASRLALALTLAVTLPAAAVAHSFNKGDITIGHPWARATPGGATVGSAYVKITNAGKAADRLTGGTFEGAGKVEVHEMKMEGEVMKMRSLPEGLEIKAGETVVLSPGGTHLMLTDLKKPILADSVYKGSLVFEKAGAIEIEFKTEAAGATESTDHKH